MSQKWLILMKILWLIDLVKKIISKGEFGSIIALLTRKIWPQATPTHKCLNRSF